MANVDSGIGESHHKTECKYTGQNTQRRIGTFDYQSANRQIENLMINRAHREIYSYQYTVSGDNEELNADKERNLKYIHSKQNVFKYNSKSKKYDL